MLLVNIVSFFSDFFTVSKDFQLNQFTCAFVTF